MRQHQDYSANDYSMIHLLCVLLLCVADYASSGWITGMARGYREILLDGSHNVAIYLKSHAELQQVDASLRAERKRLQADVQAFKYQLRIHQAYRLENQKLKQLMGFVSAKDKPVYARVERFINRPSNRALDVKLGTVGASSGMLAMNDQGFIVGKLMTVSRQSRGHLRLINDKRSAIPVTVGEQHVNAIAVGNGVEVDLIHIPLDAHIKPGDKVKVPYATQSGLQYYPMGVVDSVQTTPDKTFLIAKLSHSNLLQDLEWLVLH